jgi:hypothetical protein
MPRVTAKSSGNSTIAGSASKNKRSSIPLPFHLSAISLELCASIDLARFVHSAVREARWIH